MVELPSGTVTFLFTDIEGSTTRWERQPEAMRLALARHDTLVRSAIEEHGGHVVKTMGDAFHAVFSRAPDAVAATLDAQRRLQAEPWGEIGPLRVRMALHTGVAEERDGDYYGPTVNRAARLMSTGHGGQVLLSATTAGLVSGSLHDGVDLLDLGRHRLKDLTEPEHVFQLVGPDLALAFPALTSLDARPNNLPSHPTALLGREHELAEVCKLFGAGARLVTLTGPGGTGKTRLSLQVAAELLDTFDDGVFFVELAPISDPALVPSTIAQVLGIRESGGRPMLERLKAYLSSKSILLVLDNFEQIVVAAPVVAELLAASPTLKMLVSSRESLRVRGEREYAVQPLALPVDDNRTDAELWRTSSAVALFAERATAVRGDFAVTPENAAAVVEICRRLDGLPLAIELAAARVRLLTPQLMVRRLEQRLPLLTGGARDLPARHQTLRDTIAWSYDLLDDAERRMFHHLSVFVGGWMLDAAEAVCNTDGSPDVLEGLESLISKSLVKSGDGTDGEPRFWMLETIREYGLEQLAAAGEEATARRRHLGWCVELAERCRPGIFGPDGAALLDRLTAELDNCRSALAWNLTDPTSITERTGLRLAVALQLLWFFRDHMAEGQRWLERTIAADETRSETPDPSTPLPARPRGAHGTHLGVIALNSLVDLYMGQTMASEAAIPSAEALVLAREVGDRVGEGHALIHLGIFARMAGDLERAGTLHDEALSIARSLDDGFLTWRSLHQVGMTCTIRGDYDSARRHLEECVAKARSMGHVWGTANTLRTLGRLAFQEGKLDQAAALIEESLPLLARMGDPRTTRLSLWDLGRIALADHDPRRAGSRFFDSLKLSLEASAYRELPRCCDGLVAASMKLDRSAPQPTSEAWLLGASATMRETYGALSTGDEQALLEQAVAATRTPLGEQAFEAAQAEGRSLAFDRAIELARALAAKLQAASA